MKITFYILTMADTRPRRLVFVSLSNCDFCDNPADDDLPVEFSYVDIPHRLGYASCKACVGAMNSAITKFANDETDRLGDLTPLINKFIHVRRSDGTVEDNWELTTYIISAPNGGWVLCYNHEIGRERWCLTNEIRELNNIPAD